MFITIPYASFSSIDSCNPVSPMQLYVINLNCNLKMTLDISKINTVTCPPKISLPKVNKGYSSDNFNRFLKKNNAIMIIIIKLDLFLRQSKFTQIL